MFSIFCFSLVTSTPIVSNIVNPGISGFENWINSFVSGLIVSPSFDKFFFNKTFVKHDLPDPENPAIIIFNVCISGMLSFIVFK